MLRVFSALMLLAMATTPLLVGCGPSRVNDEEPDVQASDTGSMESPVNDADNP
jgi:hypothetical protein